jgi:hypothetical protein
LLTVWKEAISWKYSIVRIIHLVVGWPKSASRSQMQQWVVKAWCWGGLVSRESGLGFPKQRGLVSFGPWWRMQQENAFIGQNWHPIPTPIRVLSLVCVWLCGIWHVSVFWTKQGKP